MIDLAGAEQLLKASRLAGAAKRYGWHGRFDQDKVAGEKRSVLEVTRNDEYLIVCYINNAYSYGTYRIFDQEHNVHCASVAMERLTGWPDIIKMFKDFPHQNRPLMSATYRSLPFPDDAPEAEIFEKTFGKKLFWYSHISNKLRVDVVLKPKKNKDKYRVAPIGHRRLYHFIGAQAGFRSVHIDTILKVGD